jgi:hypothetical protein
MLAAMPKSPAQSLLDKLVALAVTPTFRADGYRKSARNFRRQRERCVQVVNVQASQWGSANELSFTINLGVFYPEVHALKTFLAWQPSASGPTEAQCQLRSRIGRMMPENRDVWWDLKNERDLGAVAVEVERVLRGYGRPWIEAVADIDTARLRAKGIDAVAFAVVTGDKEEARRRFCALLVQSPDPTKLRTWGRELGLCGS